MNDAALDRRLHVDVGVHRSLGLEIADRRKAVAQRCARRRRGLNGAVWNRLLEHLVRVVATVQKNVGMRVDQSRNHSIPGVEVDPFGGTGLCRDLRERTDRLNPLADDEDAPVGQRSVGRTVDDECRANENSQRRVTRRCLCRGVEREGTHDGSGCADDATIAVQLRLPRERDAP